MKNFTLIEDQSFECAMIATVINVENTPEGIEDFKDRASDALSSHFDAQTIEFIGEFPDIFNGQEEAHVKVDGVNYKIQILETWIY
jgi:hypothetical protein